MGCALTTKRIRRATFCRIGPRFAAEYMVLCVVCVRIYWFHRCSGRGLSLRRGSNLGRRRAWRGRCSHRWAGPKNQRLDLCRWFGRTILAQRLIKRLILGQSAFWHLPVPIAKDLLPRFRQVFFEVYYVATLNPRITQKPWRTRTPIWTVTFDATCRPHLLPVVTTEGGVVNHIIHDGSCCRTHGAHCGQVCRTHRRMQVGHILAVRTSITDFATGTFRVGTSSAPVVFFAARCNSVVPIGAAEIAARRVVGIQSNFAVTTRGLRGKCCSFRPTHHVNEVAIGKEAVTFLPFGAFVIFATRAVAFDFTIFACNA